METRQQEVWLIDGDFVLVIWLLYPLKGAVVLGSGERYERMGLDVYIRKD